MKAVNPLAEPFAAINSFAIAAFVISTPVAWGEMPLMTALSDDSSVKTTLACGVPDCVHRIHERLSAAAVRCKKHLLRALKNVDRSDRNRRREGAQYQHLQLCLLDSLMVLRRHIRFVHSRHDICRDDEQSQCARLEACRLIRSEASRIVRGDWRDLHHRGQVRAHLESGPVAEHDLVRPLQRNDYPLITRAQVLIHPRILR